MTVVRRDKAVVDGVPFASEYAADVSRTGHVLAWTKDRWKAQCLTQEQADAIRHYHRYSSVRHELAYEPAFQPEVSRAAG